MTATDRPPHRIDFVRPGPAALDWLRAAVGQLQARDPLAPVTVVVRSPYLGLVVRRALAETGCANVRTALLRQLAARLARADAARTRGPLTGVLEGAAIRSALAGRAGEPFAAARNQRSLQVVLGGLFRELRHQADPEAVLADLEQRGGVAAAAAASFRQFLTLTDGYYDVPELARLAATATERRADRWPAELGALVLLLPPRLDPAELRMLGRIGQHLAIRAAFPTLGEALTDQEPGEQARALAAKLGLAAGAPPGPGLPAQTASLAVGGPDPAPAGVPGLGEPSPAYAESLVVSAPDPAEEVRLVVRRIVADLEAGRPLWRVGVLHAQAEPYGALLREMLASAGLPWQAAEGRPVAASLVGRSLLGLLALRERRFAREAVLAWLDGRPPSEQPAEHDPCGRAPLSAWDRLSRQAQVLEGPGQWVERCERLASSLQRAQTSIGAEPGERSSASATPPAPPDATQARAIAAAVTRLERDTRPPADGTVWDAFVDWALFLRQRYLPTSPSWPAEERAAAEAVDAALESLREAVALEPGTTADTFRAALAEALEARRLPEGRPGRGVLLGLIDAAAGASFEALYLVGLVEGAVPSRPGVDPLVADEDGADPLGRRERRLADDRRAFLTALAAADGGRLVVSYPRSDGAARQLHPSRWLLELVSRQEGRTVYASELPRLFGPDRPWLRRVESARDGIARLAGAGPAGELAPADLHDRRLASVLARTGHDLAEHPLAQRDDLPLGAALQAARARRSNHFTAYDGNLAELANQSGRMARAFNAGYSSATAVERWAACPFQYLLQNVLGVEATTRPEEVWTISPRDRGLLVHQVLEAFFRELQAAGCLGPEDTFTTADQARIEALAGEQFGAVEAAGLTGHPLAWENTRLAVLADLHTLLEKDERWRREERLSPTYFEQTFGRADLASSWPAARLELSDGRTVAFRGTIDRIDLSPPDEQPRRALLIDYKTGRTIGYDGLTEQDPLLGGRHLQLALYARALRAGLGLGPEALEVQAEFRFITGRGGFHRLTIAADERVEAELEQLVRTVAEGVGQGAFLAVPGPFSNGRFENCRLCDYDRICAVGRDESWERKCRAPGARLHLALADRPQPGQA